MTSSSLAVLAPCPGRVVPLADVPDPVFAGGMVGAGVAIEPDGEPVTVVSPVAGRILKLHPHAFVVLTDDGVGILVHLGIDTVRLEGRGFELLTQEGAVVVAGDPVVQWAPAALEDSMSPLVPVVAMDRSSDSVTSPAVGRAVATGDVLLDVP